MKLFELAKILARNALRDIERARCNKCHLEYDTKDLFGECAFCDGEISEVIEKNSEPCLECGTFGVNCKCEPEYSDER